MKYVLIEHADAGDVPKISIFESVAARAIATRAAILGHPTEDNKNEDCPELLTLAEDGRVDFEGEPSLEWFDAEVHTFTESGCKTGAKREGGRRAEGARIAGAWHRPGLANPRAALNSHLARTILMYGSQFRHLTPSPSPPAVAGRRG